MYIKEVNITGFRSFHQLTTINDFSRKLNVVVGRNGSGKSNFFFAIQFLLSNEYNHLNEERRLNLLHEGTGNRSALARVEIIFDNTDRRIPSDSSDVSIVRQVGSKKDQFFINDKVVTKADVTNLMQAAGFSRSNPYYIVKQGKITELAIAADSYRLQLIREVAGTRVFDEKKEVTIKILEETQNKIVKTETLFNFIQERLKKLEEEKEDLKEFQKWDKMKRAIEFTVYDFEVKDARNKCDKLAAQREQINLQQNEVETKLISCKLMLQNIESDVRKLETQLSGKKEECKNSKDEHMQCLEKKTKLELFIKDLQDDISKEQSRRENAEVELRNLHNEIIEVEQKIEELNPEFSHLMEEEGRLVTDVRISEQKCKEISAKQGHHNEFKTVADRDCHLNQEISFIDRQLGENLNQIKELETSMSNDDKQTGELKTTVQKLEARMRECLAKIEALSKKSNAKKLELDAAISLQMENSRAEEQERELQSTILQERTQTEQDLRRLISRGIMNGINSVNAVLVQLGKENSSESKRIIDGYYGCVVDLFTCDNIYYKAVEATAERRLFYHVVENDEIATNLLQRINERDYHGEINFYPLNRVLTKPVRYVKDSDARPILNELRFDAKFEPVFRTIFANTVFVRNLAVGSRISKAERFDCVTLEGDQISRRGPITGGYIGIKKSKIDLSHTIAKFKSDLLKRNTRMEELAQATNSYIADVERNYLALNKIEMELSAEGNEYRMLTDKIRAITQQLNAQLVHNVPKKSQLILLKNQIREMEARKQTFKEQMGTTLNSQLTKNERQLINTLRDEIDSKKAELERIVRDKMAVESNKLNLESQLHSNLLRKRENLTTMIQDITIEEKRHNLVSAQADIKTIDERISKAKQELNELDKALTNYGREKENLTLKAEKYQEEEHILNAEIGEFAKNAEILCAKISSIQSKCEAIFQKMRDTGCLPSDTLSKYQNMTIKQLNKQLGECMIELHKYEFVNKRALDQYIRASAEGTELIKRLGELKKNEQSIKELLEILDNRRYEALQLTFKQVAKNFHDVFRKLIPDGRADLVMKTSDFKDSFSGESDQPHIMEQFIGIGIQVSFTGSSETREMSHLSGGQKTLVAIALIFAIQKCDPAPFYLFDEIDAALDPEHRKAVADVINELADKAQFITTTFRSELLEYAEKYYGVRFRNKVSYIDVVSREQAYDFVQDDQTHS